MQGTYFSDLQDLSKVLSNLKFLLAERVNGFCQTSSIKCGVPVDRCSHNRLVLSVFIEKTLFPRSFEADFLGIHDCYYIIGECGEGHLLTKQLFLDLLYNYPRRGGE